MAQKAVPTVLKKQGRRVVIYRDTDGKTYSGIIITRDSATQADLHIWRGGRRAVVNNVPVATAPKQTGRFWFV
jgi:hypothetical protein